jgi:uncharacterized protein (DUF342 family)
VNKLNKATNINEVKKTFNQLKKSLTRLSENKQPRNKKKLSAASRSMHSTKSAQIIEESNDIAARFMKIANIDPNSNYKTRIF